MIKTKTIATLGPASSSAAQLQAILEAGADVLRLNFSHGTLDEHEHVLERVRALAEGRDRAVAIMGDLAGPKIRTGGIDPQAGLLRKGDLLVICKEAVLGNERRISTTFPAMIDEVEVGDRVFIDDGCISLTVEEKRPGEIACRCLSGGALSNHKGINLPDTRLTTSALTAKDLHDLQWAVEHEVDYLALSFVRSADDLHALRARLASAGSDIHIIAKIEKPQAIAALDEIIDASDAVLVARGDLGVEMDLAQVPCLQKDITVRCQRAGKPVIIATQMLQSMIDSTTPTRAEVSDVANAICDTADAVMLSAETAVGRHPVEAVAAMQRICDQTERYLNALPRAAATWIAHKDLRITSSLADSARHLAERLAPPLVAVWTQSGDSARLLSKHRFHQPIIALTESPYTWRKLALNYGVIPVRTACPHNTGQMLALLDDILLQNGWVTAGNLIIVIAGTKFELAGGNNALLVHRVGSAQSGD